MHIHLNYGLRFTFFSPLFQIDWQNTVARQHGKHFSLKLGKPKNVGLTPVEVAEILVGWNGILNWVGLIVTLW